MKDFLLFFFILLVSFCLHACKEVDKPVEVWDEPRGIPLTRYEDSTVLEMFEGSHLSWQLHTLRLEKWLGSDRVEAKPVDLQVYDSSGQKVVHVTSDSGTVDEAVTFLTARGHVVVVSGKGVQVWTDSLRWNKQADQITTEARVRVKNEHGDILSGKGFMSDARLDHWQILSGVKAVFQKVEERLEKNRSEGEQQNPDQIPILNPVKQPEDSVQP